MVSMSSGETVLAWRLVKTAWAESAFDGEGAFRFGGRWNSRGQRVVYASSTLALALLEILVHIDTSRVIPDLVALSIETPKELFEEGPYSMLNEIHGGLPWSLQQTRSIGDQWASSLKSPALVVPSAIIPTESNFLFNPTHPGFTRCRISKARKFSLDTRFYQHG